MKKTIICLLLILSLVLCGCSQAATKPTAQPSETAAQTEAPADKTFTDSTGRTVTVPAEIESIAISGPLSQVYILPLAGDMLVGVSNA